MTTIATTIDDLKEALTSYKEDRIGFVPTMGALHDGHLSLVKRAITETECVVVSLFVNPTQFGPNEDFKAYPRPYDKDIARLKDLGVAIIFMPTQKTLYPRGLKQTTRIYIPALSKRLCGESRPQFFRGICMIVLRLFQLVQPEKAYFGEKDFQQYQILKYMITDLFIPINLVLCPIIREKDGLAMSSRNAYLTTEERQDACQIYQMLQLGKQVFENGERNPKNLIETLHTFLKITPRIQVDYLRIINDNTFKSTVKIQAENRIIFAGYCGKTRLIDNLKLNTCNT